MIVDYMKTTDGEEQRFSYATEGSSAFDIPSNETVYIPPGSRRLVGTGLKVALYKPYALFICPRSGLALKHGITVLNAPGIVDSDYRGEIKVVLYNTGDEEYAVREGDRIAQGFVLPVDRARFFYTEKSFESPTERGSGGFGSTGK